jgi:hypothetical protein
VDPDLGGGALGDVGGICTAFAGIKAFAFRKYVSSPRYKNPSYRPQPPLCRVMHTVHANAHPPHPAQDISKNCMGFSLDLLGFSK